MASALLRYPLLSRIPPPNFQALSSIRSTHSSSFSEQLPVLFPPTFFVSAHTLWPIHRVSVSALAMLRTRYRWRTLSWHLEIWKLSGARRSRLILPILCVQRLQRRPPERRQLGTQVVLLVSSINALCSSVYLSSSHIGFLPVTPRESERVTRTPFDSK